MFKVRQFEAKTLSWWYQERDRIDMSAVYQRRGGLWSPKNKSFLIDSILNEFDIPKIYIADFTYGNTGLNHENKSYAVIDGKQRFETIFDFFEGRVALADSFLYSDEPLLELTGLGYKDLENSYPKIASKFANFDLSVMSVITDDEAKISDLFVRLNTNKSLTGAEIRNAMSGEVPKIIRRISGHRFFQTRIKFRTSRGQDYNAAAKLLLIEFIGRFTDTKLLQLNRFVEEGLKSESADLERAASRVENVLDDMHDVFLERDNLLSSQGPITLYYWMIRNVQRNRVNQVREFLNRFERQRKSNREIANADPQKADSALLVYDSQNRSVDDQLSPERRYEFLMRGFANFVLGMNMSEVTAI